MAEEILRARFGQNLVDHYTYVIAGDGCLMEGVSQEAISLAGRQELSKLIVFWDNKNLNQLCCIHGVGSGYPSTIIGIQIRSNPDDH